jgi:hypothetical protein
VTLTSVGPTWQQNCIIGAFTNTTFCPNPLDQTCTCENAGFNEFMTNCVLQACSLREALSKFKLPR